MVVSIYLRALRPPRPLFPIYRLPRKSESRMECLVVGGCLVGRGAASALHTKGTLTNNVSAKVDPPDRLWAWPASEALSTSIYVLLGTSLYLVPILLTGCENMQR